MKTLIFAIMAYVCIGCSGNTQHHDQRLQALLDDENYFKLRTEFKEVKQNLSPDRQLYYEALLENVFNHSELSNSYLEELFSNYNNKLTDSTRVDLLKLQASNYGRLFQYQRVVEVCGRLLHDYENTLDSADKADFSNFLKLYAPLTDVPPQRMTLVRDVLIDGAINQFNHLMVPVVCAGSKDRFIFDTGADISAVSASTAKKMGLKLFNTETSVGSSTEDKVQGQIGVADSLWVGGALFENVVFFVMEDEALSFPQINYEIHGIIGTPIIHQMREIRMHQNGQIMVPLKPIDRGLNNLYLDHVNSIVQLKTESDTLLFVLDTGAKTSDLTKHYYDKKKTQVEQQGQLIKQHRAGVGGVVEENIYSLKNFAFKIGGKRIVLPNIDVSLDSFSSDRKDGRLGQDVFIQFDRMILNFENMYLDFENESTK